MFKSTDSELACKLRVPLVACGPMGPTRLAPLPSPHPHPSPRRRPTVPFVPQTSPGPLRIDSARSSTFPFDHPLFILARFAFSGSLVPFFFLWRSVLVL